MLVLLSEDSESGCSTFDVGEKKFETVDIDSILNFITAIRESQTPSGVE